MGKGKEKELKLECKKLDFLTGTQKCIFCNTTKIDEYKYGPIYMHRNIITHYFCLLLSSNMEQNGRDSDGILGFLHGDILKEVRRGTRLHCSFCKCNGATLGCAVGKCKVMFHLPCGLKMGSLHQFFGEFKSYCARHRPVQKISGNILAEASKESTICGICYDKVVPRPISETLWAPCCKKNAFFHRDCVQKLAISAGYFFKCPLCNSTDTFQQAMKHFGVYIPEQDASWECVPQAYQDLLVRHDTCDSPSCRCPTGRKTNTEGTRWELILCKYCGSQGMHIGCGRLQWNSPEFECNVCSMNSSRNDQRPPEGESSIGNRHRLSGGRQRHRQRQRPPARESRQIESSDSSEEEKVVPNRQRDSSLSSDEEKIWKRVKTPEVEVVKNDKQSTVPSPHIIVDDSSSDDDVIAIDSDGDSDLKTSPSDFIKTKDGCVIPVVKIGTKCGEKRPRRREERKPSLPDEVIDISLKMAGPPKRPKVAAWTEPAYDQPSTSCGPAAAYVPPEPTSFIVVDSASLRPEDVPSGMVLYRSVQGTFQPPAHAQPPQPIVSQIPTTAPMQQLGPARHADAQHTDIRQHRSWCSHYNDPQHLKRRSKKTARENKRNSVRRRRKCRGCDPNRLNPLVLISPLKFKTSVDGHLETFVRKNLLTRKLPTENRILLEPPTKRKRKKRAKDPQVPLLTAPKMPRIEDGQNADKMSKQVKQRKLKLKKSFMSKCSMSNCKKINEYFTGCKKEGSNEIKREGTESHEIVKSIILEILAPDFSTDFHTVGPGLNPSQNYKDFNDHNYHIAPEKGPCSDLKVEDKTNESLFDVFSKNKTNPSSEFQFKGNMPNESNSDLSSGNETKSTCENIVNAESNDSCSPVAGEGVSYEAIYDEENPHRGNEGITDKLNKIGSMFPKITLNKPKKKLQKRDCQGSSDDIDLKDLHKDNTQKSSFHSFERNPKEDREICDMREIKARGGKSTNKSKKQKSSSTREHSENKQKASLGRYYGITFFFKPLKKSSNENNDLFATRQKNENHPTPISSSSSLKTQDTKGEKMKTEMVNGSAVLNSPQKTPLGEVKIN